MEYHHPHGSPLTILNFLKDFENVAANDQLSKMFEHPDVKDRKIVAFSVVGAYRKGKSFFLNYCMRFLYAHYPSINFPNNLISNPNGWMGEKDEPLVGFSWRSGSDLDTNGIVMWNDIFLHTIKETGDEIAIVVIDTQGLYNNDSSLMENMRISTITTLISSIQVLNLSGVVQEDQLQNLQLATQYAKFALNKEQIDEKPLQKLFFLIRDWNNPHEYPFGKDGGDKYLSWFFESKTNKREEFKSIYDCINSMYEDLSCLLLPNPGKNVSQGMSKKQSEKYDGNWSEMDEDFKGEFANVIEQILTPEKLTPKKLNGRFLTGAEFLEHMQLYFNLNLSNNLPEAQTVLESVTENEINPIIASCIDNYKDSFKKLHDETMNLEEMLQLHNECKENALILFSNTIKIGDTENELKFRERLSEQIDDIYKEFIKLWESNKKKVEEENEKIRVELEERHKHELEERENEIKSARIKYQNEIQEMKEEIERKKRILENQTPEAITQSEQKQEETEKSFCLKNEALDEKMQDFFNNKNEGERKNDIEIQYQQDRATKAPEKTFIEHSDQNCLQDEDYYDNMAGHNLHDQDERNLQQNLKHQVENLQVNIAHCDQLTTTRFNSKEKPQYSQTICNENVAEHMYSQHERSIKPPSILEASPDEFKHNSQKLVQQTPTAQYFQLARGRHALQEQIPFVPIAHHNQVGDRFIPHVQQPLPPISGYKQPFGDRNNPREVSHIPINQYNQAVEAKYILAEHSVQSQRIPDYNRNEIGHNSLIPMLQEPNTQYGKNGDTYSQHAPYQPVQIVCYVQPVEYRYGNQNQLLPSTSPTNSLDLAHRVPSLPTGAVYSPQERIIQPNTAIRLELQGITHQSSTAHYRYTTAETSYPYEPFPQSQTAHPANANDFNKWNQFAQPQTNFDFDASRVKQMSRMSTNLYNQAAGDRSSPYKQYLHQIGTTPFGGQYNNSQQYYFMDKVQFESSPENEQFEKKKYLADKEIQEGQERIANLKAEIERNSLQERERQPEKSSRKSSKTKPKEDKSWGESWGSWRLWGHNKSIKNENENNSYY